MSSCSAPARAGWPRWRRGRRRGRRGGRHRGDGPHRRERGLVHRLSGLRRLRHAAAGRHRRRRGDLRRRRPAHGRAGRGPLRRAVGRGPGAAVRPGERRDLPDPGRARGAVLAVHPAAQTAHGRPDGRGRGHLDAGPGVRAGLRLASGPDPVRDDGRPADHGRRPGHRGQGAPDMPTAPRSRSRPGAGSSWPPAATSPIPSCGCATSRDSWPARPTWASTPAGATGT